MNIVSTLEFSSFRKKASEVEFIHLKKKFAAYNFIYHINDGYSIDQLHQFSSKHQLLFQKEKNRGKQLNLMMVDSIFPIIVSDLILSVLLYNVSTFAGYTYTPSVLVLNNIKPYSGFLKYKLIDFINHLLYSNIVAKEMYNGEINLNKIYYFKNNDNEIKYYSIYDRKELKEFLFTTMTLEIDLKKSFIKNDKANICLLISI